MDNGRHGNAGRKRPEGSGRKPGTPNKATGSLKEAILEAAKRAGNGSIDEYLQQQAREQPVAFMSLLGRILPREVQAEVTQTTKNVVRSPGPAPSPAEWLQRVKDGEYGGSLAKKPEPDKEAVKPLTPDQILHNVVKTIN